MKRDKPGTDIEEVLNAKPRATLLSSRTDWISLQILILFICTVIYTVIIWRDESADAQTKLEAFKATVGTVVIFSHFVIIFIVGIFELGGAIMLFYFHKIEQATKQGIEQGRAEVYSAWHADWEKRRQEAAAKDIPFNEPPPPKPENGTGSG